MTDDIHRIGSGQETVYENYIIGFIDGINMSTYGKSNFFEATDPTARYQFVKKYCEENPLSPMVMGIAEMVHKVTGINLLRLTPHLALPLENQQLTARRS